MIAIPNKDTQNPAYDLLLFLGLFYFDVLGLYN